MPIVHVHVWKGFSDEAKKKVIAGMTKVLVDMGIPAEAVEVVIHEIPKTDWGVGGEPASERLKRARVP
ncbi:MAG: tautomerase family protein [Thermoplasmata archaeon]